MNQLIEFIDITEITRDIKKQNKFVTQEEMPDLLDSKLLNGVIFKDTLLDIIKLPFNNPFLGKEAYWYYFKCPECGKKSRKIFFINKSKIACRKCCKIKNKLKVNTQSDRVLKIQQYLSELFNSENLTNRKKNKLVEYIVTHYNRLDDKYRFAYNTYIFTEIQNWCLDSLENKNNSNDYKKAVNDMLSILQHTRKILVKSGLANPKNKKLKI
jgi:hypothetical protein